MEKNKIFRLKKMWLFLTLFLTAQFFCFLFQIYREGTETSQISDCQKHIFEQYKTENPEKGKAALEEIMEQLDNDTEERDYEGYSYSVYYEAVSTLLEQMSYITEYSSYIEGVLHQADAMSGISIFADTNSFSNANLSKTKWDYAKLQDVQPALFWNEYITRFLDFVPMHGLALLAGIVVVFALLEEKKKGLKCMIFATVNGRGKLLVSKIFAMFLGSGLITLLFYGTGYLESSFLFSGNVITDMAYPIQSVPALKDFVWNISIGEFCMVYLLYRWLVLFLLMLLIFTVLFLMDNPVPAFGIMGIAGVAEFALVKWIEPNSSAQWLRYVNLWYIYADKSVFTEYKNLSFFGMPLSKNLVLGITCGLLFIVSGVIAYLTGTKKYPCEAATGMQSFRIKRIREKKQKFTGACTERKSIIGMEVHKILFLQKGWLVLLVLCLFFFEQRDFTKVTNTAQQEMYYHFMEQHEGIPDEDAKGEIKKLEETISKITKEYNQAEKDYEEGNIDISVVIKYQNKYAAFEQDRKFLEQIKSQTKYLEQLKQVRNIDGWYVNQYSYLHMLDNGNKQMIEDVLFFMGVVLLCSGVFSFERKSGTKEIITSSTNGRKNLFRRKLAAIGGVTFLLFGVRSILELACVWQVYGLSGLGAPVQSISCLSFVGIPCTIGTFFLYLYLIKILVMLAVVCFVCLLSVKWAQKVTIGLSVIACIPSVLYLAGISFFQYFSVFTMLNINSFLLQVGSVGVTMVACMAFIVVGVVSLYRAYRAWCPTGN